MSGDGFAVKVVGGATGSGRSLVLRKMMGAAPVIDLSGLALTLGRHLELSDLSLPEDGAICIDQASVLSDSAIAAIVATCSRQGRRLVLGTQDAEATVQTCASVMAALGLNNPIEQTKL